MNRARTLWIILAGMAFGYVAPPLAAQSVLIPVTTRQDLVYDPLRHYLYITTTTGAVERYNITPQTLIAPLPVGTSLNGADITPDAQFLYVGEATPTPPQGFVKRVNLNTGAVTNYPYTLVSLETGVWDIAIGNNGKAVFTTLFAGSGWNPLRTLDLATGIMTNLKNVRQNTHIFRSADRSTFFLAESNISSTPTFTFDLTTNGFPATRDLFSGFNDAARSAVNRNGTLIAHENGSNVLIMSPATLATLRTLTYDGGLIFDPVRDILYAVNSTTDQVEAIDTNTWAVLSTIPIGENVPASGGIGVGVMAITADGGLLFLATPTGVRMLTNPLGPGVAPPPPGPPPGAPPKAGPEGSYGGGSGPTKFGNEGGYWFGGGMARQPLLQGPFVDADVCRVVNPPPRVSDQTSDSSGVSAVAFGAVVILLLGAGLAARRYLTAA